jgi:hypothetical protein
MKMHIHIYTYIHIIFIFMYTYIGMSKDVITLHDALQQGGVDSLALGSYADLEWYNYIHLHTQICIFIYVFI